MSCCKLVDTESMNRRVEIAKALGMSLPQFINEFCQECSQWHTIQIPEEHCDHRFGLPPIEVPQSAKSETYIERRYCSVCHAYHNKDNRCGGAREAQDWETKEIG